MAVELDHSISSAHADALGCAARVAQAYGDHPETAVTRMRWARTAVASAFGGSQSERAHALQPRHYTMLYASCAA